MSKNNNAGSSTGFLGSFSLMTLMCFISSNNHFTSFTHLYCVLCFIADYSHSSLLEQTFEEPEPLSPQIQPDKHISSKFDSSSKIKTTMAIAIDVESATG